MRLKSSIIRRDTIDKSLTHLSNNSYNSIGLIKYQLLVSAFNIGIHKTSNTISLISSTLYKLNFFTYFYPKMV